MKKIFVGLLALFATFCLVACNEEEVPTLKSLTISGQETEFVVGDSFDKGELVVTATLSDDTTVIVTDKATVTQNADMNTPGSYAVLVSYEGQVVAYQIVVTAKENVETLKAINVDVNNAKVQYEVGQSLALEGVTVYETYSNTESADTIKAASDLSAYSVKVTDSLGQEVTGAFVAYGTYTVTISKGELSDSYAVRVGAKVYASLEDALTIGVNNAEKVNAGTVVIDNSGSVTTYSYAFGQNHTEIISDYQESYFEKLDDENVFGVTVSENWDGELEVGPAYLPTLNNLLGVDLGSVVQYAYEVYGVEALLTTLNDLGKEETSFNYEEYVAEYCAICGLPTAYGFKYEIIFNEYYYYFVEVEFVIDDVTEIVEGIYVEMNGYFLESMIQDEETGLYTVKEDITEYEFTKEVVIEQSAGAREIENPYKAENLLISSFELKYGEDTVVAEGQELKGIVKEQMVFEVAGLAPETANPSIDEFEFVITDAEGNESFSVFGSYEYGFIYLTGYKAGKYNVTVKTTNVSLSFVVEFGYAELTSFAAGVYDENSWELVEQSEATMFTGGNVTFGAIVNDNANASFTAELKEANENVTLNYDGTYYNFECSVVGTYEVVLTSEVNEELSATLTITVEEAPSVADLLNGTYSFTSPMAGTVVYVFTPASEGALNGTLTINASGGYFGDAAGTFNYTFYEAMNYLDVQPADEASQACQYGVELDVASYQLLCTYNYFPQGPLVEGAGATETIVGTYFGSYTHPRTGMVMEMILSLYEDGTGGYYFNNYYNIGYFSYEYVDGTLTFSNFEAAESSALTFTGTIDGSTIYLEIDFYEEGYQLSSELTK